MSSNPTRAAPAAILRSGPVSGARQAEPVPPRGPRLTRPSRRSTGSRGSTSTPGCGTATIRGSLAYLEAENAYTQSVMRRTEGLQERLYQEMRGRIKETDLSVPDPGGRLALLHPDRDRRTVPDLLPAPRRAGEPRGGAARPERARGGACLLPAGRLRGESGPPAPRLFGGHQRGRVVHPGRSRTWRPASSSPSRSATRRPARRGPTTAARCSTSCSTTPAGPAASTATPSASDPAAGRAGPARDGRIVLPGHRPDAEPAVPGAGPREPFDVRGAGRAGRRRRPHRSG